MARASRGVGPVSPTNGNIHPKDNASEPRDAGESPVPRRDFAYPHRPKKVGLAIHEGLYGEEHQDDE